MPSACLTAKVKRKWWTVYCRNTHLLRLFTSGSITRTKGKMEAAGYFEPLKLFISLEELLRVECIQTFDELFEFCRCEEKSDIVKLMQQLLFNVHLDQYSSTGIEIIDFWDALDLFGLHHEFVPKGVLIYNMLYFQNASDQAQDWISQEMVKPHVRMMKEKLKFTDVQIINGLRILHDRGEEITFASLLNTLVPTENALLNVYVGMGKYAFSTDIRLVLRKCYDIYQGEPTQEQFELEWNRIKGTGIEHLMEQVEIQKTRADRTEIEALNREAVLQEEMRRAEEEMRKAEEEKRRAEEEKRRAEEEKLEALNRETLLQKEKKKAEKEKLKAMRDFNNAIEVRNEAVDEIIQVLNREEVLKKEKEAERVKAVKLEKEKEAERLKAVKLEKEKEAERVKAEAEREKAEAERVKAVKLEKEKEVEREKAEAEREKAEAERVKAEAERVKAEAERIRAEKLEKELAKMTALFEEEKKQLLLQMQQMAGLLRA